MTVSTPSILPLRWTRLFLSTMTLIWSIIVGAITVQLLIKGHKRKNFIRSHVSAGVVVDINNDDIQHIGIGVLIASSLLSSAASNPLLFLLQDMFRVIPASMPLPWGLTIPPLLSNTTLRTQAYSMLVSSCAVLGTIVPFTLVARTHAERVTASLNGAPLSAAAVAQMLQTIGITTVYWDITFIRIVAIIPWFSLLFAVPLTLASFAALHKVSRSAPDAGKVELENGEE